MRGEAITSQPVRLGRAEYGFLFVMTFVNMLNYLDRNIINILAELIREDMGLKDWQLGALTGLSFALLYTIVGIPAARLAQSLHRPTLLGAGVAVWSAFTIACGAATSFATLALARAGVGIGEGFGAAASHSLVVDRMPRSRRATGMAIFSTGMSLGGLFGMALGGLLAERLGWRAAFVLAGAPGLLLAGVLVLAIRDPRGGKPFSFYQHPLGALAKVRFVDGLKALMTKKSFPLIAGATASGSLVGFIHGAFFAVFFLRLHGDQLADLAAQASAVIGFRMGAVGFLGVVMGVSSGVMGVIGMLAGGLLTDRLARNGGLGAYMTIPAVSKFVAAPLSVAALLAGDAVVALGLVALVQFSRSFSHGPALSSVHALVPAELRPTAAAIIIFIITIIAPGVGPIAVGLLSDTLASSGHGSSEGLRLALLATEAMGLLAAALFMLARPIYIREVRS